MPENTPPDPTPSSEADPKKDQEVPPTTSLPPKDSPESFFSFAKKNTRDTVAYILLLLGIVWIFFDTFYGGILVGIVSGLYFAEEVLAFLKSTKEAIDNHGSARNLILAGTLLAFFISAPGIFLGGALIIGLKQALAPSVKL